MAATWPGAERDIQVSAGHVGRYVGRQGATVGNKEVMLWKNQNLVKKSLSKRN